MSAPWKTDISMSRPAFDGRRLDKDVCAQFLSEWLWPQGFVSRLAAPAKAAH